MESVTKSYHASPYIPSENFAFLDCKTETLLEAEQNRALYYEYIENQMRMKNFMNYNTSVCDAGVYNPAVLYPSQQKFNEHETQAYPSGNSVYGGRRLDRPKTLYDWTRCGPKTYMENNSMSTNRAMSYGGKGPRARSMSSDRRRRRLAYHTSADFPTADIPIDVAWDNNSPPRRNRNFSGGMACEALPLSCNVSYETFLPGLGFNAFPSENYPSDSIHGRWRQLPWSAADFYNTVSAISPASPLDSGLSSQSIASSPSLETESLHAQRIPECGSPLPLSTVQNNQCSCSTNSFPRANFLSPPMRSDSGRSSPWATSAISRLNALMTQSQQSINTSYIDQRRYSMSGIYVSPKDRSRSLSSDKISDLESGNRETTMKKRTARSRANGLEHLENNQAKPSIQTARNQRPRFHGRLNLVSPRYMAKCNGEIQNHKYQRSSEPESSISLQASTSLTDLSSPGSSRNDLEFRERNKASSKYSEKAICELEDMYNKLNLQDSDLLDRAERRDLPTAHQIPRFYSNSSGSTLTRSKSDSFYEILGPDYCRPYKKSQRTPPARRSGIPDLVGDDMALRKLQKSSSGLNQMSAETASYLLYSSHFTPPISVSSKDFLTVSPDVDYDDLSYRRYFQVTSNKIEDPQPPFGIPLKPMPQQSIFSDYMHVVPSGVPQPLCHPRGNPDLVRDDLAFRALRKDDPERAMYDSYTLYYRKIR